MHVFHLWEAFSHYFFRYFSVLFPSPLLLGLPRMLIPLMVSHRSTSLCPLSFILFSLRSSDWIISVSPSFLILFPACSNMLISSSEFFISVFVFFSSRIRLVSFSNFYLFIDILICSYTIFLISFDSLSTMSSASLSIFETADLISLTINLKV